MRGKRFIVMGAVAVIMALALPAQAATAGTVKITAPRAGFVNGDTVSSWTWTAGSVVRSTSKVDVTSISSTGERKAIATAVPISRKSATWATSGVPDDTYAVEVRVRGTNLRSSFGGVVVDNTAPALQLLRPAPGEVIVDDLSVFGSSPMPVVLGSATFGAAAADKGSGLAGLMWFLDGDPIGSGQTVVQDFSDRAGWHTVAVRASDVLGNTTEATQSFFGGPGAVALAQKAPAQPGQQQSPDPGPQPGASVPRVGPVPTPTAGLVPQPLPPVPAGPSPIPTPSSVGELAEWVGWVVADEIAATINPLLWRANATCGQIGMQGCQPGSGGGGGGTPCSSGCVPSDPTGCLSGECVPNPGEVHPCLADGNPSDCGGPPPIDPIPCIEDTSQCPDPGGLVPPCAADGDPSDCAPPPQCAADGEPSDCVPPHDPIPCVDAECPAVGGAPLETVIINAGPVGGIANSVRPLVVTDQYLLVVSGTYHYSALSAFDNVADAECSFSGDWRKDRYGPSVLDLLVDSVDVDWKPETEDPAGTGCNAADHRYTVLASPNSAGATFQFAISDPANDNFGALRVDIYDVTTTPILPASIIGSSGEQLAVGFIVGGFAWIADLRRRRLSGRRPEAR